MKQSTFEFEVSPDRDCEKREVSLPPSKDQNMVIIWRGDFKGVLDHIKTGVQELFYPSCTDLAAITVCCDRFWLSNDADVQYIVEKEEHPHQNNFLHLTCKYNAERDNERHQATDDQLFDSIIQLCIEDTFPYSKAHYRKYLGKLRNFECVPTKHFYTMMEHFMRVLQLDQDSCKKFRDKIHRKTKALNVPNCHAAISAVC